jgi:PadR family transcriptional regulator, regulatory protein AphA
MTPTTRRAAVTLRQPRLGPAEHSLLGLLAGAGDAGIHGYDLARQYTHGALSEIIRLESGMLYHHLKKLDRYEMITTQIERQPDRPDRQLHTLTALGRERLDNWLREPVHATREVRLDFLLKLFFTRRLVPGHLDELIEQQRSVLTTLAASLGAQMHELAVQDDTVERRMVLRLRQLQTEAALTWLDSLLPMEDDA